MADLGMPDGLGGFASSSEGSPPPGTDADFGTIEMFDSNASQPVFSSQLHVPAGFGRPAPEAPMSEEPASLSKKSKREKKHRKHSFSLHDADAAASGKKHKKHKKKWARGVEVPDSQPEVGDAAQQQWEAHRASPVGEAPDGGEVLDDQAVPNGHGDAENPSTQSKKKRKMFDSADGKRRKKRRSHGHDGGEDANVEALDEATSTAAFLRRIKDDDKAEVEGASEEERVHESDPQRSPTVAHLRRRSQSHEVRSRENSAPAPKAERMDVDLGDDRGDAAAAIAAAAATDEAMDIDPDVETLAREAWNEHKNGQNALAGSQAEADAEQPSTEAPTTATPQRRRSTRKKSKPTFFEQPPAPVSDDEANRAALGQLPSPTAATPKPRNRSKAAAKKTSKGRKPKREKLSPSARGGLQGPEEREEQRRSRRNRLSGFTQGRFTDDELSSLAKAVEGFRVEHGLSQEEVNTMIHAPGGTGAGDEHAELWNRIFADCPGRHRQKIINTARKRFHNFVARGTWTPEQDAELSELISIHGAKWSQIGAIINRHPEDLRDRYRNYLVCGPNQRKDSWDEAEEARLTQYIIEAMMAIDELRANDANQFLLERSYEELIDWQDISERMGRTRSRLQCITKWKALNIRTNGKDKLVSGEPDAQISFRLEKARRQIVSMPEEERFRLVLAIQGTAVGKDSKIPWQRLVDKAYRNQWHRTTQMLLWRRLRQAVPGQESKSTRDCCQYLVEQYNQAGALPDVSAGGYADADEMQFVQKIPVSVSGVQAQGTAGYKSAEFVHESDSGNGADAGEGGAAPGEGGAAPGEGGAVPGEDDIQIDPALTQEPDMATRATPAKRTGSGKPPSSSRRAKRAAEADPEPMERGEGEEGLPTAAEQREGPDEGAERSRKKKTARRAKSAAKVKEDEAASLKALDSDSAMDELEDLPARVAA